MRRVDDAVNAFRRWMEGALPWFDPEAEAERDARVERLVVSTERDRLAYIGKRMRTEDVVKSYRRADGTVRR